MLGPFFWSDFCFCSLFFVGAGVASASLLLSVPCHHFHLKPHTKSPWLGCFILNMMYVSKQISHRMGLSALWILSSPLHGRIHIGILAWHFSHSLLKLHGHVYQLAQLFDLVHARFVPFSVLKGKFSLVLKDIHCMMNKSEKDRLLLRIMMSPQFSPFNNWV